MATDGQYENIRVEVRDRICLLTLHRPDRLNAWTPAMSRELVRAIRVGNDDPDVGAFVMTGEGRGFCAGADIQAEFGSRLDGDAPDDAGSTGGDWVGLVRSSKPMVAAINGPAIGVGLTMVLPMDFLVAAESAKVSCRFVKMGITPELASSHYLVQRMGWGAASDLALSGRTITGGEAARVGLVDEAVPDGEALDAAMARAATYAENPGPQMRAIKELLTANAVDTDLAAVQRRELDALHEAFRSPEHHEAVAAFTEKRAPRFH